MSYVEMKKDLRDVSAQLRELYLNEEKLIRRRNELIFILKDGAGGPGVSVRSMAVVSGLTEGRIYQILRAGPNAMDGFYNGERAMLNLDEDNRLMSAVILDEDGAGFDLRVE